MTNNGNKGPEAPQSDVEANGAPQDETQTAGADMSEVETATGDASHAEAPNEEAELSPEAVIEALRAELAEANDRYLRSHAEMENLRKRTERELANKSKYAVQSFAESVLTVGDNIQRAIQAVPEEALRDNSALKSLLGGITLTERELMNVLERHGVRPFDAQGEQLDPNIHLAMFEIENADVPAGTILQVVQAGYMIGDRLLRPAQVGVAKGGPKPGTAPAADPAPVGEPDEIPISEAANDDQAGPLGNDPAESQIPVDETQETTAEEVGAPGHGGANPDTDPAQNS